MPGFFISKYGVGALNLVGATNKKTRKMKLKQLARPQLAQMSYRAEFFQTATR